MDTIGDKYIDLVKTSAAFKALERDARGRLSHAYLLVSPDRLALNILADLFIAMCVGGEDAYRRVSDRVLTDIIVLPEAGEKVLVKDIDYLTDTAYVTPTEADKKFYVIDYGETMSEPAQNKLLKTLEEPPAVANVIIKTASIQPILPTVRSRCRTVELKGFPAESVTEALKRYYPDGARLKLAAAASRGLISEAERLISGDKYAELFELCLDLLKNMKHSSEAARYAGRLIAEKDHIDDVLEYIEIILRDCLTVHAGRPKLAAYPAGLNDTRRLAAEFSPEAILGIMPVINAARARLALNGNINGTVDELLFSILEVKAKCRK